MTRIAAVSWNTFREAVRDRVLYNLVFFALLLNQNAIYKAQTGGAQPHIHPSDLRPIAISVPATKADPTTCVKAPVAALMAYAETSLSPEFAT